MKRTLLVLILPLITITTVIAEVTNEDIIFKSCQYKDPKIYEVSITLYTDGRKICHYKNLTPVDEYFKKLINSSKGHSITDILEGKK